MNSLYTCNTSAINRHGKARVLCDGRYIFVPGAAAGETVSLETLEDDRGRLTGKIVAVIKSAEHRIDPDCKNFPDCPGCTLRHLQADIQQDLICTHVMKNLRSKKLISSHTIPLEFISIPQRKYYRRRCSLKYSSFGSRYLPSMRSVYPGCPPIDLSDCPNHHPVLTELVRQTSDCLNNGWMTDDDFNRIREVHFTLSDTGKHRITFVHAGDNASALSVEKKLQLSFENTDYSVLLIHVKSEKAGISYKTPRVLYGESDVKIALNKYLFYVQQGVWSPVSVGSAEMLLHKLRYDAELSGAQTVIEVGCGAGLMTIPLLETISRIIGIDKNRFAIESAKINARMCGLSHESFIVGDAVHALRKLASSCLRGDMLIIHGMRRPYGEDLFYMANVLRIRSIILMSPSLFSWVRDVEHALTRKWELTGVKIFDQIPQTSGFLFYAQLQRNGSSV